MPSRFPLLETLRIFSFAIIGMALLSTPPAYGFTVYAHDYGFNPEDATLALQAAVNSGADCVIVENLGTDWIIQPIHLTSDQELIFRSGVVVTAKPGAFHGNNDCLFKAYYKNNILLTGYGAVLRMQKEDYISFAYQGSQWRHVLSFLSCNNITVKGLTLNDSGGDGIFIGAGANEPPCQNIHIADVVCDNNYRAGIGVNSVSELIVENSVLINTKGYVPQTGIGLETDFRSSQLVNCLIINCHFQNNAHSSLIVNLRSSYSGSKEVSITFSGCTITNQTGWGIHLATFPEDSAGGWVRFQDCLVDGVQGIGLYCQIKAAYGIGVIFESCTWKNVQENNTLGIGNFPLLLTDEITMLANEYGGLRFIDCVVEDQQDRYFLKTTEPPESLGCANLKGNITVINPHGARIDLGPKAHDIDLLISGKRIFLPGKIKSTPLVYPNPTNNNSANDNPLVYPNPAKNRLSFRFSASESETVSINLFNISGRRVSRISARIDAYHPVVTFDVKNLIPGIYVYTVSRPGRKGQGKICIQK